jgi:hypothetical protein
MIKKPVPDSADALPHRHARIELIRQLHQRFGAIIASNYDVTDECNLACEGCLYFAGLAYKKRKPVDKEDWELFFRKEADRGINFGYFAGAEPSLVPHVLRAATKHIPYGVIFTNGIKRISDDIRYRIHISLWGNQENNKTYRGADNSVKALRNYQQDSRAIAVYTINRCNIENIFAVSEICASYGIPITYNYFSPTDDYLARLHGNKIGQSKYYRATSHQDVIILSSDDFRDASAEIAKSKAKFPDYVLYSLDYDHWVTQHGSRLYQFDEKDVAIDCGNRLARKFHHYNVDLSRNTGKCCSPNIDCRECRAYTNGYATLLSRLPHFRKSDELLGIWAETWRLWATLFLLPENLPGNIDRR